MRSHEIDLTGNVGKTPEINYTPQGKAVCKFSVACNEKYIVNGKKKENQTWFNVTLWEEKAEHLIEYIRKGDKIRVRGQVQANAYIDKTGKPQASLEVTAFDVMLLSSKPIEQPKSPQPVVPESTEENKADVPF